MPMHAATSPTTEDRSLRRHPLRGSRTRRRTAVMRVTPISAVPSRNCEPSVATALGHHAMMPVFVPADTRVPSAYTVLSLAVIPASRMMMPLAVKFASTVMSSYAVISTPALIAVRCMGNCSG